MALNASLSFATSPSEEAIPVSGIERYELHQGMSELWEMRIELLIANPAVNMATLVDSDIIFDLIDEPFLVRVQGISRGVRQLTAEPTGLSRYELLAVPALWLTTCKRHHRIFQKKSVTEIINAILEEDYGGRIPKPQINLTSEHPAREYTVQYGETDYDFMCRLLAEEGIAFYFDHAQKTTASEGNLVRDPSSVWVLIDDTANSPTRIPNEIAFLPSAGEGQKATEPHVMSLIVNSNIAPSAMRVRDYDFEKPEAPLDKTVKLSGGLYADEKPLVDYHFEVGRFASDRGAEAWATQLLEEHRTRRDVYLLESSFSLCPGTEFHLSGHPRSEVGDLMVVRARSVFVSGDAGRGRHQLECIPARTRFRPQQRPKPRIYGTQTAKVVVQTPGEEIDVDVFGRVIVEFHWDTRDKGVGELTRRVRVSQGWAGANFGFVMLPRVNEEVIISFLDGDPDEPIIVGRVHNTTVPTPLNLPKEKMYSIWRSNSYPLGDGYNQILMDDTCTQERLELRAQHDFKSETFHDSNTQVGHNQSIQVKGSQSTSAGSISMSSGSTIDIEATGNFSMSAGGELSAYSNVFSHIYSGAAVTIDAPSTQVQGTSTLALAGGALTHVEAKGEIAVEGGNKVDVNAPEITVTGGTTVAVGAPSVDIGNGNTLNAHAQEVTIVGNVVRIGQVQIIINGSSVEIKGATVNIGDGTVNIDGGTVNINGGAVNINC